MCAERANRRNISTPAQLLYTTYTIGSEVPIRHWFTIQLSLVYVTVVLRKRNVRAWSHYAGQSALGARAPRRVLYNTRAQEYITRQDSKGFFTNVSRIRHRYGPVGGWLARRPINNNT